MPTKKTPTETLPSELCLHDGIDEETGICPQCNEYIPDAEEKIEPARFIEHAADPEPDLDAMAGVVVERDAGTRGHGDAGRYRAPRYEEYDGDPNSARDEQLQVLLNDLPPNEDVTVVVVRRADANLKFRTPCPAEIRKGSIVWGRGPIDDIYTEIQQTYGGGRYRLQLRYGARMQRGWNIILDDLPETAKPEPPPVQALVQAAPPEYAVPVGYKLVAETAEQPRGGNSIDDMIEQVEKVNHLRELLAPNTPAAPVNDGPVMSAKDQLTLEMVRSLGPDDDIKKEVTRKLVGIIDKDAVGDDLTWGKAIQYGIEHQEQLGEAVKNIGLPILEWGAGFFTGKKKEEAAKEAPAKAATYKIELPDGFQPKPGAKAVEAGPMVPISEAAAPPVMDAPADTAGQGVTSVEVISRAKPLKRINLRAVRRRSAA